MLTSGSRALEKMTRSRLLETEIAQEEHTGRKGLVKLRKERAPHVTGISISCKPLARIQLLRC